MILFACVTTYHILESIIYKLKYYPNDEAVLMISEYRYNDCDINLLHDFFKAVIPYQYNTPRDEKTLKENKVCNILNEYGYKIKSFNEIYVLGSHCEVGANFIYHKISFNMFEEAAGILSNVKQLEDIDYTLNKERYMYAKENGLYDGNNPLIKKIICNLYAQKNTINNDKIEHFDCTETLGTLDSEKKDLVLNYYVGNKRFNIPISSVIIFTQHFAKLKIHTIENSCLIYQIFIDYFYSNKNIVFKTHPDDILYYGLLFPKATIIRDKFLSEIMPFVFTNPPMEIATISSTSVDNLKKYYKNSFQLDSEYGHTNAFLSTHKIYIVLKYIEQINKNSRLFVFGYPISLFKGFICKEFFSMSLTDNIEDADFIIIDDFDNQETNETNNLIEYYQKITEKQEIIYINSKNEYLEYNFFYELVENIYPIVIEKEILRQEHIYQNTDDEIFFIINKQKIIVKDFYMAKELVNTGISMQTKKMTKEEIRIKVLEGVLEATEKRVVYLLEENKKLKEKIEGE